MENTKKRTLTLLSSFQIVISVMFFILGLMDGLEIRFVNVSLMFSRCWIVPLVSEFCLFFNHIFVRHLNLFKIIFCRG